MKTSLPSITKISMLSCDLLTPHLMLKVLAGIPIGVFCQTTPVTFYGKATCETDNSYHNGGRYEKTTLKFMTLDDISALVPMAFVVTTASGNSFLIGTFERPYPKIRLSTTAGSPSGEPAVLKVTVSFGAQKSLLPCFI